MIWQNLMKKPMLILGILLFVLFLNQDTTKRWWANYGHRFIPNTCMSVKERVENKMPDNWEIECPGTEKLILTITSDIKGPVDKKLRSLLYKQLANSYVTFVNLSNLETLEMLQQLNIKIAHPKLTIYSQAQGKDVIRFSELKRQEDIALHLKGAVRVKEIPN